MLIHAREWRYSLPYVLLRRIYGGFQIWFETRQNLFGKQDMAWNARHSSSGQSDRTI